MKFTSQISPDTYMMKENECGQRVVVTVYRHYPTGDVRDKCEHSKKLNCEAPGPLRLCRPMLGERCAASHEPKSDPGACEICQVMCAAEGVTA